MQLKTLALRGTVAGILLFSATNGYAEKVTRQSSAEITVGAGLLAANSGVLPGVTLGVAIPVLWMGDSTRLLVGLESGGFFQFSNFVALIPIAATVAVKHRLAEGGVELKGGISVGGALAFSGGASGSGILFFVEPGVGFQLSNSATVGIEPRFGVVGSAFAFAPRATLTFGL